MRGISFLPVLFLLFSIISRASRKAQQKSANQREELESGIEQIQEKIQPKKKEEKIVSTSSNKKTAPLFGTEEYKEQYDFQKEKKSVLKETKEKTKSLKSNLKNKRDKKQAGAKEGMIKKEQDFASNQYDAFEKDDLLSRELLKKAFIMKELLDKPVSLRR